MRFAAPVSATFDLPLPGVGWPSRLVARRRRRARSAVRRRRPDIGGQLQTSEGSYGTGSTPQLRERRPSFLSDGGPQLPSVRATDYVCFSRFWRPPTKRPTRSRSVAALE